MTRLRILLFFGVLALLAPQAAFARGNFDPTTEFEQHEWIPIHLGPLNLSITKAVVYLMLGTICTIGLGLFTMRSRLALLPGKRQTVGEALYEVAQTQVAEQGLPDQGDRPLVPVRRDAAPLHLRGQPARLHPAAADR